MNNLSRERRASHEYLIDYFKLKNYTYPETEKILKSKHFRLYFSPKVYPDTKVKECSFFNGEAYYPETYLRNPYKVGKWFIKPSRGSNGKGILITDNLKNIKSNDVVFQRSVENLLLNNNKKQDIRVFVVLQTYKGHLYSYIYNEAYVRLSSKKYDKDDFNINTQLTNFAIYNGDINESLEKFTDQPYYNEIYPKIKDIVIDFSNKIYKNINNKTQRNLIQLFGFDFIPDNNNKVWLLEINDSPGPTMVTDMPKKFKSFRPDFLDIMLDELIYPMGDDVNINSNKFKQVFKKQLEFEKWITL